MHIHIAKCSYSFPTALFSGLKQPDHREAMVKYKLTDTSLWRGGPFCRQANNLNLQEKCLLTGRCYTSLLTAYLLSDSPFTNIHSFSHSSRWFPSLLIIHSVIQHSIQFFIHSHMDLKVSKQFIIYQPGLPTAK